MSAIVKRMISALAFIMSATERNVVSVLTSEVSAVKRGVVPIFKRSAAVATIFLVVVCSYTEISATVTAFCMTSVLTHEVSAGKPEGISAAWTE